MNLTNMSNASLFDGVDEMRDDAEQWYHIVILTVLGGAIILENVLVLVAVCMNKKLQELDNISTINVACADLLSGMIFVFHFVVTTVRPYACSNMIYCALAYTAMPAAIVASVFALMVMSVDRYIGVSRPLEYAVIVTPKRIAFVIAMQWIVAIFLAVLPVVIWKGDPVDFKGCVNTELLSNTTAVYLWYFLIIFLPILVLLMLYGRLFCVAYRHARRVAPLVKQYRTNSPNGCEISTIHLPSGNSPTVTATPESSECVSKKIRIVNRAYKATLTLGIIMICMVLTFIPTQLMFVKFTCNSCIPIAMAPLRTTLLCAQVSNSALNPLIYASRMKEFRRTFCRIFRIIFCCKCNDVDDAKPVGRIVPVIRDGSDA
ncbi:alpha-1A adrenergic receptor-like [Ptychodera flava]|uniref:alpha-1A adrenergic receptor-like n=1 Tax=Ptychodera flava TaxID=63121 RepID=UPI00396A9DAF